MEIMKRNNYYSYYKNKRLFIIQGILPFIKGRSKEIFQICRGYDQTIGFTKVRVFSSKAVCAFDPAITANPGDLIEIVEYDDFINQRLVYYYRVSKEFSLVRVRSKNAILSDQRLEKLLSKSNYIPTPPIKYDDTALQTALEDKHQKWLVEIIEQQVEFWRENNPKILWRLMPSQVSDNEIEKIVSDAPFLALKNFKNRLTRDQVSNCMKNCPKGAIRFAFEEMENVYLHDAIYRYSDILILAAADKLDEETLAHCININYSLALNNRSNYPERIKAIILSSVTCLQHDHFGDIFDSNLKAEYVDSIQNEFETWVRVYEMNEMKSSDIFKVLFANEVIDESRDSAWLRGILTGDPRDCFLKYCSTRV